MNDKYLSNMNLCSKFYRKWELFYFKIITQCFTLSKDFIKNYQSDYIKFFIHQIQIDISINNNRFSIYRYIFSYY